MEASTLFPLILALATFKYGQKFLVWVLRMMAELEVAFHDRILLYSWTIDTKTNYLVLNMLLRI